MTFFIYNFFFIYLDQHVNSSKSSDDDESLVMDEEEDDTIFRSKVKIKFIEKLYK